MRKVKRALYLIFILIGLFLSYAVLTMFLNFFWKISPPFPENFNKSIYLPISIIFVLPMIGWLIYEREAKLYKKMLALIFWCFWLIAVIFLIYSILER